MAGHEMFKRQLILLLTSVLLCRLASGQTTVAKSASPDDHSSIEVENTPQHDHSQMNQTGMDMPGMESHRAEAQPVHLASGTSWQPFSTPHTAWMWQRGGWNLMAHG